MPRAFTPQELEEIRGRLMEVGRAALSTTGFRKTTVDQLARGAGISKGGFYLFFADKVALWMTILEEAERALRRSLEALAAAPELSPDEKREAVLSALLEALTVHPILRALGDPDELAWLIRAAPTGAFEAARVDDDRFFSGLYARLVLEGAVRPGLEAAFCALPRAALALVNGRGLIGEADFEGALRFEREAWSARLAPD